MRCFKINLNEVRNRLDASFYAPMDSNLGQYILFKDLGIEIRKGIFNLKSGEYLSEGVPFINSIL